MAVVPTGRFQMGDLTGKGFQNEKPAHPVQLKAFRLGKYEVTFDQYDAYAQATGKPLPADNGWGRGNRPVINVSWDDAQGFIAWLNQVSGLKFRLPSETEWEYAARAGTTTDYPWGNEYDPAQANGDRKVGKTTAVGSYPANAFGFFDMVGNVWEWTADCYNNSYDGAPNDGSAWTAGDCTHHVARGGAWINAPMGLRISPRHKSIATDRAFVLGFRLAQDFRSPD